MWQAIAIAASLVACRSQRSESHSWKAGWLSPELYDHLLLAYSLGDMPALALPEETLIDQVLAGERISREEARALYELPLNELGELANLRRNLAKRNAYGGRGEEIVTYIVDRNINYTNVCNVYCKFCAFYRTEKDEDHYVLSQEQIDAKLDELAAIGGRQVLLQGGHHPGLGIDHYLSLLTHIREKYPQINIHGFSPPEFQHFSQVFGLPLVEVITRFKEAGLGSIPGGGGEILVDSVRQRIAPLKCKSDEWLEVMRVAHGLGLNSSATMMFGHVETVEDRIEHLQRLRELQDETGGFTAFICWTFQPEHTKLRAEPVGSSEYLRMQALSRIYLDNFENVQSSWVTQGPKIGQIALKYGANDFGSVMMEENVVSSAGTTFRLNKEQIERLIGQAGYEAHQRDTWYNLVS
jgi:cyclic dehypoxanthinyl futalosine synthase